MFFHVAAHNMRKEKEKILKIENSLLFMFIVRMRSNAREMYVIYAIHQI